ncbi:MAG: glucose 1-dehydrogenase [Betaproteobacteria bacterium]|jgi:threonine dehydrogenase-like Zn-dependent dehydrogenase|nr:glucose 1-dehydrogenase [Betaproteobacteria bacterium]
MRAVTLAPGEAQSLELQEVEEPRREQGAVHVRTLAIGVCGTDRELIEGTYGEAPPGKARLILGHESLGRVIDAPKESGFTTGDVVVGIVRHPDPVPCISCALGEWDMCRNGRYTERGIKEADGFAVEHWRAEPAFLVKVDPRLGLAAVLLEPASVLAKAWEHIERIGLRSRWAPQTVLVTGAGTVGLMAALMGMQHGLEVHVMDHNEDGPKPQLARDLGATYHTRFPPFEPDIVVECTGSPTVIAQAVADSAPGSIVCLTGLGGAEHAASFDVATLNQSMVLENRVVFGTVNANLRHYRAAAHALARADHGWLGRVITRRTPLSRWREAYEKRKGDVKTVLVFED